MRCLNASRVLLQAVSVFDGSVSERCRVRLKSSVVFTNLDWLFTFNYSFELEIDYSNIIELISL